MQSLGQNAGGKRKQQRDLAREQRTKIQRIIAGIIIAAVTMVFFVICYERYIYGVYTDYEVLKEYEKGESNNAEYLAYKDKILKYSNDGASVMDKDGKSVWNGSYNMKNPSVSMCGDYVAIADIGGKEIYIFDGKDSGKEVKVLNPIIQVDVGGQGVVAVAMEKGDSSLIAIYDPYQAGDTLRVEIPTMVNEDGFPVDIALSRDGQKLVTAFIDLSDGVLENRVTFYNFDEVGQNDINRQTGMVNMENTLISKVDFLRNDLVCIYTEQGFSLYSMKQKQEKIADIVCEESIRSVMSCEQYVGVVLEEYSGADKYHLLVYNLRGKKILDKELGFDYDNVQITNTEVIFSSELDCHFIRLNGRMKFEKVFDQSIMAILPFDDNKKYYLISEHNIQQIQLVKK